MHRLLLVLKLLFALSLLNNANAGSTVIGYIDPPTGDYKKFTVRGWACQTGKDYSIEARIFSGGFSGSGGTYVSRTMANLQSEQAVANSCGNNVSTNNRYSYTFSQEEIYKHRNKTIYVHGISPIGTGNPIFPNSGKYTFPNHPTSSVQGYIDRFYQSGSNYFISGWACQTYLEKSVKVHVYAGGPSGTGSILLGATADKSSEVGIANACQTGFANYRFNIQIPRSKVIEFAGKSLYVHAISPFGTGNKTIGNSGVYKLPDIITPSINDTHSAASKMLEYEFTPFYQGQIQSQDKIRNVKSGNAVELAGAFLHKAIEESGISSENVDVAKYRFKFGRIRVTPDELKQWLGFEDVISAAELLQGGGNNVVVAKDTNNNPLYIEFDHVWSNIDGTDFDPSYKKHTIPQIKNIGDVAGVTSEGVYQAFLDSGLSQGAAFIQPDLELIEERLFENETKIKRYLESNPSLRVSDFRTSRTVHGELNQYDSQYKLPYTVVKVENTIAIGNTDNIFSALPKSYRQFVKVSVGGISEEIFIDEAAESNLYVDYIASTSTDQNKINSYGGVLETPVGSVNVKPRLMLDDKVVATGTSFKLGDTQDLLVSIYRNNQVYKQIPHKISVGGIHSINLNTNKVDLIELNTAIDGLQNLANRYSGNLFDSKFTGPLLSLLGKIYHRSLDVEAQNAQSQSGYLIYNKIQESVTSINLSTRLKNGKRIVSAGSRRIDVPVLDYGMLPFRDRGTFNPKPVAAALGMRTSSLEHQVFTRTLGWPAESTMSILRFAAQNEEPIYALTKANYSTHKAQLTYSQQELTAIEQELNGGRTVITPKGPQIIRGWRGIGYISVDNQTGSARYVINDGLNGGEQVLGDLDTAQMSEVLSEDTTTILGAAFDGFIGSEEIVYDSEMALYVYYGVNISTEFFVIGDFRNILKESYNLYHGEGSAGELLWAAAGILPIGDLAKTGERIGDAFLSANKLNLFEGTLKAVSEYSGLYVSNLSRHADITDVTAGFALGAEVAVVTATRDGMTFTNVALKDSTSLSNKIGYDLTAITNSADKGNAGEYIAREWGTQNGLTCFYCKSESSPVHGFDNIFIDANGVFVISEAKWSSSSTNVGASILGTTTDGSQQLSEAWIQKAIGRSGLSASQASQLTNAIKSGNFRTQLVVVKPTHKGTGISSGLASHADFGVGRPDQIGEIIIVELPGPR